MNITLFSGRRERYEPPKMCWLFWFTEKQANKIFLGLRKNNGLLLLLHFLLFGLFLWVRDKSTLFYKSSLPKMVTSKEWTNFLYYCGTSKVRSSYRDIQVFIAV